MSEDKRNQIIQYIKNADFNNAKILFDKLNNKEKSDLIISEASTSDNITIIGFIDFLISKEESCFNHELAALALIQMSWIEGAYNLAFFHAAEMLKLQPDLINKEFMLFFYTLPEKILSDEYACILAKDIIEYDPDNKIALEILDNCV